MDQPLSTPNPGVDVRIGMRISAQRIAAGLAVVDVARRMGVDPALVTAWEAGQRPSPSQLIDVAEVLRCSIADLLQLLP